MSLGVLYWGAAFFGACAGCFGQSDRSPHFEVASIRPVTSDVMQRYYGGIGSDDPGRATYTRVFVRDLIEDAYKQYRAHVSGPDWLDSEYAISAIIPKDTTPDQYDQMMANLLEERFGLVFHVVQKETTAYELVVAKGGPKLTPSPSSPASEAETTKDAASGGFNRDTKGFPIVPAGLHWRTLYMDGVLYMTFRESSMAYLANTLSMYFSRYFVGVADATGLSGKFDFHLRCPGQPLNPGLPPADADLRIISPSLEQQPGLALRPIKVMLGTMVVDHVNRTPVEN